MKPIQPRIIIVSLRLILLSMVVLVGAGICMDIKTESVQGKSEVLSMIDQRLSSLFFEINDFPRGPGEDVVFLSRLTSLKKYVSKSQNDKAAYSSVLGDFDTYRKQSEAYAGIEYISSSDKSHSQFQEIADKLNDGTVYISKLQRISKNGEYITGLYYVTPVFDASLKRQGMVVLTVDANYFLDDIRNYSKPDETVYLIDSKGFYLAHPDKSKEFLAGQEGMGTFVSDYPDIGEKILSSNERWIEDETHVFSLRRIHPTASSFEAYGGEWVDSGDELCWILVSVYNKPQASSGIASFLSGDFFVGHLAMFASVLILAVVGMWGTRYLVSKEVRVRNKKI